MNEFETKLKTALDQAGIQADPVTIDRLSQFYMRIIEKNKVMNLTAITEPEEFILKHFVDALSLVTQTRIGREIMEGKPMRMIDVGTGCGIPGLALKIVYPQLDVVLSDSLKKRLVFLDEVIDALGLKGVRTVHGRAEDLGHDKNYRQQFDLVTARAVANLRTLAEYCLPLAKQEGYFAAYKGPDLQEELGIAEKAIRILGGETEEISSFLLPSSDQERCIAIIRKTKPTPAAYPRKAGTPLKDPL